MRLPAITYPLAINGIGILLATGHEITVHCSNNGCGHYGKVDLVALGEKLGLDHGTLEKDLKPHFYCLKCRAAGRPDRNIGFILHPQSEGNITDGAHTLSLRR